MSWQPEEGVWRRGSQRRQVGQGCHELGEKPEVTGGLRPELGTEEVDRQARRGEQQGEGGPGPGEG